MPAFEVGVGEGGAAVAQAGDRVAAAVEIDADPVAFNEVVGGAKIRQSPTLPLMKSRCRLRCRRRSRCLRRGAVPPTVMPATLTRMMPKKGLPSTCVPVMSVPIKLPSITVPADPGLVDESMTSIA